MINRTAAARLLRLAKTFRSVVVTGPRQSGKTTLCRTLFPQKPYVSLENPDILEFATADPRGFLAQYKNGAILDEVQRALTCSLTCSRCWTKQKRKGCSFSPALIISYCSKILHKHYPDVLLTCSYFPYPYRN